MHLLAGQRGHLLGVGVHLHHELTEEVVEVGEAEHAAGGGTLLESEENTATTHLKHGHGRLALGEDLAEVGGGECQERQNACLQMQETV